MIMYFFDGYKITVILIPDLQGLNPGPILCRGSLDI